MANVGAFVQLADERACGELLDACLAFAAAPAHLPHVLSSESYLALLRRSPELGQQFTLRATQRALPAASAALQREAAAALQRTASDGGKC